MTTLSILLEDASRVAEVRRKAAALGAALGFGEGDVGRVALVASELATNVVRHARHGEMLLDAFEDAAGPFVQLVALDQGPGIVDLARALEDGYSTAGTPGTGLGAVRRAASRFDVWSHPGAGVVLAVRIRPSRATEPAPPAFRFDGLAAPKAGEAVCGDAWAGFVSDGLTLMMMADGLGHGLYAAEASGKAVRTFLERRETDPGRVVELIHQSLAGSRGAAVACVALDHAAGQALFCGVGNIAGAIVGPGGVRRMVSHNGTAGVAARRFQIFSYPLAAGAAVILHSDGLSSGWSLDRYPGLAEADPLLIATVLYRDHSRRRDDSGVAVAMGS